MIHGVNWLDLVLELRMIPMISVDIHLNIAYSLKHKHYCQCYSSTTADSLPRSMLMRFCPLSPPSPLSQRAFNSLHLYSSTLHFCQKNVMTMPAKHEGPAPSLSPHDTMPADAAPRVPPPEKPEAVRTRTKVIAAFWAVIIFLGFPIWWQTTSIHRARLPVHDMFDWANGKVCSFGIPVERLG